MRYPDVYWYCLVRQTTHVSHPRVVFLIKSSVLRIATKNGLAFDRRPRPTKTGTSLKPLSMSLNIKLPPLEKMSPIVPANAHSLAVAFLNGYSYSSPLFPDERTIPPCTPFYLTVVVRNCQPCWSNSYS